MNSLIGGLLVGVIGTAGVGVAALQAQAELPSEVLHYAEMVLYNGKVLTADESFTIAQAVAVREGKILAVGETDRILRMAGPNTLRIDLEGNHTVTPGFIGHHTGGEGGQGPGGPSYLPHHTKIRFEALDDGLRQIKAWVEKAPPGEWVFVNSFRTAAAHQLTRQLLDPISPANPLLVNLDNTMGFVNTEGLRYVPEDVKAGIFRDEKGEPTGKIAGWAYGVLTYEILPYPDQDRFEEMVQTEIKRRKAINKIGVTTLGTRTSGLRHTILWEIHRRGENIMRTRTSSEIARLNPHTERYLKRMGNLIGVGDEWFKISGATVSSIDSTVGNAGYLTRSPKRNMYSWDAYGPYGQNKWAEMVEPEKDWKEYSDYQNALLLGKYGWNVTDFHVQGDGGVELALEVFDKINEETPVRGQRYGIVHGVMRPLDLLKRLAEYDAILNINPDYLFAGSRATEMAEFQYGPDAMAGMSPVRDIIDAGMKPALEVRAAGLERDNGYLIAMQKFITRRNVDTGRVWGTNQRITREEALKMATAWAARFSFDEDILGTIEPGKLADLVVLGGDFMTVPEEEISKLPILKVIVGGKITYEQ